MSIELAHFALILALSLSVFQTLLPILSPTHAARSLYNINIHLSYAQFGAVSAAFAGLTLAYITSDFSVSNVYENSHTLKPLIYKISGVWGNHEGSMLLWVWVLSLFTVLFAIKERSSATPLNASILSLQGLMTTGFLAFILFTSNPFLRLSPAPFEGQDLNPTLQDPGLAIHPPLLYIGYVGLSLTFAFAAAALIHNRVDSAWARQLRPWVLTAWAFLTLGIALGSYWAYYELGWGGFWFWDPVENASLVPWLIATALIHCVVVLEKREALKIWSVLLALMAFTASLIGTFLVRSGILTSVHSFANDPDRGLFILLLVGFLAGGSLVLFLWRAPAMQQGGAFRPISREGALVFNNLFLATSAATVLVGTLYPLALEALTERKISVGAPFFNLAVLPLLAPLLLVMPLAQRMAWKRADLAPILVRMVPSLILAGAVSALALWVLGMKHPIALAGIALGLVTTLTSLADLAERSMAGEHWKRRLLGLPKAVWGTAIAHAGMGISTIGIAASLLATEEIKMMKVGDQIATRGYTLTLEQITPFKGSNFEDLRAIFTISNQEKVLGQISTAKRLYTARQMPTTEAGLYTIGASQLYIAMGEINTASAEPEIAIRLHHKPLVLLIWIGALFMALGGALAWLDRRKREKSP